MKNKKGTETTDGQFYSFLDENKIVQRREHIIEFLEKRYEQDKELKYIIQQISKLKN